MTVQNHFVHLFTSLNIEEIHQGLEIAKTNPDETTKEYTDGYIHLINAFHKDSEHFFSKKVSSIEELKIDDIAYLNGEVIKVDNREIQSIPSAIGLLKNLKELHIFANSLTSIPNEIGKLEKLEKLVLEGNLLTGLPEEIGNLKNLRHLNLNCNRIESLPSTITNLKLEALHIIENSGLSLGIVERIAQIKTLKDVWLDAEDFDFDIQDSIRDEFYFCDNIKFG
ncbi:MAG TPA: hypothetical protein DCS93_11245 [Microscillaceae bacterium]|nr:hypothetical protein [Microscillaceae bacterium]